MDKVFDLIEEERRRQEEEICLIASENYMSKDVLKGLGSVLVNKYSEGYPAKRYYGGCRVVDKIEQLAIDRACELFDCKYANVQPNSGCQANQAVYMAICKPNDTILGMSINDGGHISHTLKIGFAGTFYKDFSYGIDDNGIINYEEIEEKINELHPRLLIVGASAYPRVIDFERIRKIVDTYNRKTKSEILDLKVSGQLKEEDDPNEVYEYVKCYMMVDMAHIAGLVATKQHPSPFPYADVVTSTVQKTLRSGRGGLILTNDEALAKKINKAIFPRLQGGPLQNMIAGKAIGFGEALKPEFTDYQKQVLSNIQAMVEVFNKRNVKMVSGGSDNHLILLDLKDTEVSGQQLEDALSEIGIVVNKNAVKNDPRSKSETSGVRLGTACITTRGMKEDESKWIAHQVCDIIDILTNNYDFDGLTKEQIMHMKKDKVKKLCKDFPIYKD